MGLDYSQKRLLGKALGTKKHSARAQRLRLYAFLTGVMSMLISLATLIVRILK
jgi:hypothetical protein